VLVAVFIIFSNAV